MWAGRRRRRRWPRSAAAWPDALRSDGHYGYDGTFLVDLPEAGEYVVTPLIGDAAPFYHDLLEVTAEGAATPQLKLSTHAGPVGIAEFRGQQRHAAESAAAGHGRSGPALRDQRLADPAAGGGEHDPNHAAVPGGTLDADGMTVDTYTGARAPANSLVTVATTLGTVVAGDDLDATWQGVQVRADEAGVFTFHILRPSGLSTNPETATITAQEIEGRALGQGRRSSSRRRAAARTPR